MLPNDISQIQPIIDTRTGCVEAWRVRLTLRHEAHTIFDDIELPIEEAPVGPGPIGVRFAPRQPLLNWTQRDVIEFITRSPRLRAQRQRLTELLAQRCYRMPICDFTIEQLQGD